MHDHAAHPLARGQLQAGLQVPHVAVHAAARHQTHEVQRAAAAGGLGARLLEHAVGEEVAVGDRLADAREVLVDDAAGADVEMPDLGVAHLARRQPHRRAGCLEGAVRVRGQQPVEDGSGGQAHGVAGTGGRAAPAVQDHEHDRPLHAARRREGRVAGVRGQRPVARRRTRPRAGGVLAAQAGGSTKRTMRANSCASRLAPPTSTPSMSGCAMSTSMLAALTLPP